MLNFLKTILNAANSNYEVFYNEAAMMNIDTTKLTREQGFVYIEEFTGGEIDAERWLKDKPHVEIYFCKFADFEETAEGREALRTQIKQEIVYPFIKLMKGGAALKFFREPIDKFTYFNAVPRFDDHEVSILLEFDATEFIC